MSTSTPTNTTHNPAPRTSISRLTMTRRHHPDADLTELEQDCVTERSIYAIRKILQDYGLTSVRPEQADAVRAVLLGDQS